jgi:mRNA interferase MazF
MPAYVPDRGEIIWISFDPKAGHEQGGRRPAVVISPRSYNRPSGLALLCPITNRVKGYPFEVALPAGAPVTGVVLADQLRNLDWRSRKAELIGILPAEILGEIIERLRPLIALDDE